MEAVACMKEEIVIADVPDEFKGNFCLSLLLSFSPAFILLSMIQFFSSLSFLYVSLY